MLIIRLEQNPQDFSRGFWSGQSAWNYRHLVFSSFATELVIVLNCTLNMAEPHVSITSQVPLRSGSCKERKWFRDKSAKRWKRNWMARDKSAIWLPAKGQSGQGGVIINPAQKEDFFTPRRDPYRRPQDFRASVNETMIQSRMWQTANPNDVRHCFKSQSFFSN